ncbi:enolase-like [Linepithema humile]|uniref:enolase-like n=1 Tax=Linepithema humile TaxID=83485 RepID=UPI0006236D87|nr:PREDICTED: enolase-like [Linepithema humile]
MTFQKIKARQVFDCRGEPTLEVDVSTSIGTFRTSVPSTVDINPNQAHEIRDGKADYQGRSVFNAVDIVNKEIGPALIRSKLNVTQQRKIDELLNSLDGTKNKSKLGANTILGVSVSCCKAGATQKGIPIYRYIAKLAENDRIILPVPYISMINGGQFAGNNLPCQEFAILPTGAQSFAEAMKMATKVYQILKNKIVDTQEIKSPLLVSDEGAFAPNLENDRDALTLLNESIIDAGHKFEIKIALDMAASAFYKEGRYDLAFKKEDSDPANYLEAEALRNRYLEYLSEFPIISIEDPFHQGDWESWLTLANQNIQIVSDALTAMNIERIGTAIERNVANCLTLRISQIGTVTEVIDCAKMAKISNWNYMVSASRAETEDTFIADLAVGLSACQLKAGAPCRGERISKYNRILQIEEELGRDAIYVAR